MIFTMTDETYAVNCNLEDQDKEQVMFYIALFSRCYWLIGTVLGAVLGNLIPFDLTGIDFCMTALFIISICVGYFISFTNLCGRFPKYILLEPPNT